MRRHVVWIGRETSDFHASPEPANAITPVTKVAGRWRRGIMIFSLCRVSYERERAET